MQDQHKRERMADEARHNREFEDLERRWEQNLHQERAHAMTLHNRSVSAKVGLQDHVKEAVEDFTERIEDILGVELQRAGS